MLKVGPTESIPGKSSPGRPTSKSLRSGLWKEPLASAVTLKVAEASPERPPVKACLNSGQEVGVYRTDWPTYQLLNIWGNNCTGHNEPDVCGQLDINTDVHLQTGLKRRAIALLGAADRLIEHVEVLIDVESIE